METKDDEPQLSSFTRTGIKNFPQFVDGSEWSPISVSSTSLLSLLERRIFGSECFGKSWVRRMRVASLTYSLKSLYNTAGVKYALTLRLASGQQKSHRLVRGDAL